MSLKLKQIYSSKIDTQETELETELLGSKTITTITTTKRPQTINEYKTLLKESKIYDEKKKDKQLLNIMLYSDNMDCIEKAKLSSKNEILMNYVKIWNVIKHIRFNKDDYNYNFSNSEYIINQIFRSIFKYKIQYPILKLNKLLFNLNFYKYKAYHKQKTSKYIIPRTELILINTTTDFYETITLEKFKNEYIKPFKNNSKHSIYLYPFQQALTPNEKILSMEEYNFKNLYEAEKDFTSDYLYYCNDYIIYRYKLLYVVKLEENKLLFQDIYYYFFNITWNNNEPINTTKDNYICYIKLDIFKRQNNKLLEFKNKYLGDLTKTSKKQINKKQTNKTEEIRDKINLNLFLDGENIITFLTEFNIPNNIKLLLDQEKLTPQEIDNLFNPQQEQEERLTETHTDLKEQRLTETHTDLKNIINSDSDSDIDTDTEEEEEEERLTEAHTDFLPLTETHTERRFNTENNLTFNYNRNYIFSNDDKFIIQNAFINKLNTNKKLQKLTNNYNHVRIIKPFNKTYTQDKYFNFILTNKYNHYSKQYHAYINDENKITTITEITNKINYIL